jgi:hypothetical protein
MTERSIQKFIGRRPIGAFGNSDDDLQMLQWTCAGPGASGPGIGYRADSLR